MPSTDRSVSRRKALTLAARRQQRRRDARTGPERERGAGRAGGDLRLLATLDDPAVKASFDKFYQPTIYMNTADDTACAAHTFAAEKNTIERLGPSKKN